MFNPLLHIINTSTSRSAVARYSFALLAALAAAGISLAVEPTLGPQLQYAWFYPALILTTVYGGRRSAYFSLVIMTICTVFLLEPRGELWVAKSVDLMGLFVFLFVAMLVIWLSSTLAEMVAASKLSEESLQDSQRMLSDIVERCPFGIYIVDAELNFLQMNRRSQEETFINVQPVLGRRLDEAMRILWGEDVAADVVKLFRHTLNTGDPYISNDFVKARADEKKTEGL